VIEYLDRKQIDDRKWDECIRKGFNGNLYGYSWYLDIAADHWAALVENDYERVFPLVFRRKYGFSYIYQPFFTQQLGLYSRSQLTSDILNRFIGAIPRKFRLAEINLNILNKADEVKLKLVPQLNHELDLINSYEKIREGYSDNLQRNLKKAERSGLNLFKDVPPDEIISIFRDNRGKEIRHLRENDYRRLLQLAYACLSKDIADIRGVFNSENKLVAGAFFMTANRKSIFFFSGLTPAGRENGAMPFLIDSFIREHAGKHLTFDFDGSNDPNLARFYKSFGSRELMYQRIYINRLPGILRLFLDFYKKIR
jgi:hypothetical protein